MKNCPHVWTGPYKFTYVGCHPNTLNVVKAFANRYSSVDLSVPTIPWTRIWIRHKSTIIIVKKLSEKNENKQKKTGNGRFFKLKWSFTKDQNWSGIVYLYLGLGTKTMKCQAVKIFASFRVCSVHLPLIWLPFGLVWDVSERIRNSHG